MKSKVEIPEWLLVEEPFRFVSAGSRHRAAGSNPSVEISASPAPETNLGGCTCVKGRLSRRSFVEKTIEAIADVLREEVLAGQLAKRPGLLQGIDPRIKVLTTLLLILVVNFTHHATLLLAFNLWLLWLAKVSQIPVANFIKRVWLVVPLFTGVIILPSLFNFVHDGEPLLTLITFSHPHHFGPWTFPESLTITRQGVLGALVFLLRVGASVSLALLLTLSTRWNTLLKALGSIFIPQIFLTVLEMTYRYIYLFLQSASEIFVARKSRTVGRTSTREQRRFVSGAMGALWSKAYAMSEEVYAAMLSRGYTGQSKTIVRFQTRTLDWLWALFMVIVSLLILGGDRILV